MQHAHRECVEDNIGIAIISRRRFEHGDFVLRLRERIETYKPCASSSNSLEGIDDTKRHVVNWDVIGCAERGV
jgi:hypothetical protein